MVILMKSPDPGSLEKIERKEGRGGEVRAYQISEDEGVTEVTGKNFPTPVSLLTPHMRLSVLALFIITSAAHKLLIIPSL